MRSLITGLQDLAPNVLFRWANSGPRMLRITVQEGGTVWRLQLSGRLVACRTEFVTVLCFLSPVCSPPAVPHTAGTALSVVVMFSPRQATSRRVGCRNREYLTFRSSPLQIGRDRFKRGYGYRWSRAEPAPGDESGGSELSRNRNGDGGSRQINYRQVRSPAPAIKVPNNENPSFSRQDYQSACGSDVLGRFHGGIVRRNEALSAALSLATI
jgi:hypothetical protein